MDYQYTEFRLPPEDIANSQYAPEFGDVFGVNEVNQEYHDLGTVLSDGGDMYGVSSVVFDKNEELFWMGNQGGHVTSYYGPSMQKYTSFQVHSSEEVRSLLTIDEGILALTKTTLRHQIRRGIPKFTHKSSNMVDMQCLIALESNRIVMGGHQNKLIEFDISRLEETKQHSLGSMEARCAILRRHSYLLVAGDPSGRITLRDPVSLRSQHVLDTHSASLSDFDVQGNLIVTCGFSNTQGAVGCDCFLLVYDVRALRPLPPLPVCCEPLLLRFMPAVSSRLAAVTAHGQVQLVDTINTPQPRLTMFQVNTQNAECLSFDISSTSQAFGFGDQSGHLHLFSPELNTEPAYNNFSRMTEFADTPEEIPFVSYTDETFLPSTIPLPPLASGARWLSDWPDQFTQQAYRMPRQIDPEVMRSIKMQGPIGYAPNPHTFRRNQMPYVLEQPSSPSHGKCADNSYNSSSGEGDGSTFVAIPKRYRKVEVRYSKSGTNEFEFDHYNKTGFPGLEATLPNSYCNAMLQVLYYIFPVKKALFRHTCTKEFCLTCELGFLFRMLDTTSGAPCQASNFLRAFRTVPEASALGLILSDRNPEARMKTNLGSLIQSWNRFILHQMHYEILETRKREMEADHNVLADRLSTVNLSTPYKNNSSDDPYRNEDFVYQPDDPSKDFFNSTPIDFIGDGNNSDCYQLKTPAWRKRREAEERDRISLLMVQDEGKYLWLSPTALDDSGDVSYYDREPKLSLGSRLGGVGFAPLDYRGAGDSNATDMNDSESFDGFSDSYSNNDENVKKQNHDETEISRLFGTKQLQVHKCLRCDREEHKESIVLLCNLQYPNKTPVEPVNFTDILKSSLCPRKTTPAWCDRCRTFSPTVQCCSVTQLPHLLAVNCGLSLPADKEFWQKQMDFTVSAALGHPVSYENNSDISSSAPPSNRPCRYGTNCSRPGCRFKHPNDALKNRGQASPSPTSIPLSNSNSPAPSTSTPTVLHHLYGQYPWLPHDIIARLSSSGQLTIDKADANGLNSKGDISNQFSKSKSSSPPSENGSLSSEYLENNHNSHQWKVQETRRQYSLSAVVCYVDDAQKNIVSLIKMNGDEIPSRVPQNGQPQWYLFNDFCVSPISAAEVCWFNLEWKSPCVLFYRSVMAASHWSSTPSAQSFLGRRLSAGRVFGDDNLSIAPTANFTPLTPHEFLKRGELVGMDAEFVTLNQEEAELRSDGRLSTIRPSHLAVARITCVRGQGPLEGTPFIDDYISTQEQVVDYLTKFSGINPGDLDANFSSKRLTTLKSTYQKLRCLVDTGVVFVGHGLNNDFRVINLVVPPEQIIDTVQLFHLPHHRMVSLKFLAWHLLDTKIQSETHDSTEDARTALQLYRRYVELEVEGSVNQVLATLYETGKIMQWKVPED